MCYKFELWMNMYMLNGIKIFIFVTFFRFPKYFISHRNIIDKYLAQFLDAKQYNITVEAAKCYLVFQQVINLVFFILFI